MTLPADVQHVSDTIDRLAQAVAALGSSRARPAPMVIVLAPNVPYVSSVRLRIEYMRIATEFTDNFELRIGAVNNFMWSTNGADGVFPLPFLIDNGVPMTFVPIGGTVNCRMYVVAYPV